MSLRHAAALPTPATPASNTQPSDWSVIKSLWPYLAAHKGRISLAIACLIAAKVATVAVPIVLKHIVDAFSGPKESWRLPLLLLFAYAAVRIATTLFQGLREFLSDKVAQRTVRAAALNVFNHLHGLSLRFHLSRQTGGLTRDVERGTRAISTLISYAFFSILPTLVEITLVGIVLVTQYDWTFFAITLGTIFAYIGFTIWVTEWRTNFRRAMNDLDSKANTRAIDSLINYETVKYFNNEAFEAKRYDESLQRWETAAVKSQTSLSLLNLGQSAIIAVGVTLLMWRALEGVLSGRMTVGDLVLVNAFMIQLYMPLNFLGVLYREIKQALADLERMFKLVAEQSETPDSADAKAFAAPEVSVAFDHVDFGYESNRQILHDVSFEIPAGKTLAVVGASGSGKSTLARLLFRFYDVQRGAIRLGGTDVRELKQADVRRHIGIVPQDTVLFNDSIGYNIRYGRPEASELEMREAARAAHIEAFVESLPDKFETAVGERGLKLSGGEKQRVAIARAVLKNPPVLIFDEATSALDSKTEKVIQAELREISQNRTTLVIAHRLSTIVDADQIIVMEQGRIMERGTHASLLAQDGAYAKMWALQQQSGDNIEG